MKINEIDVIEFYKNDEKLKKKDVSKFLEWITQQHHLPEVSELQAALFLHSCFYSIEMAKTTIDTYFTVRTLCPDIFETRNMKDPQIQKNINGILICPLSKLCPNGELVIFVKLLDSNAANYNFTMHMKLFDMITLLHYHKNGPPNGLIIVFDMEGATFSHFFKLSVVVMKKFLYYLQEGLPVRLKGLHFCNIVSFMDKLLALMKPFMKKELMDAIILHRGMETAYEYIPKEVFPQDYGGTDDSLQISHEKFKALINDNERFFNYVDSQLVDESKRPGRPVDISDVFGMEGTFKKLELD